MCTHNREDLSEIANLNENTPRPSADPDEIILAKLLPSSKKFSFFSILAIFLYYFDMLTDLVMIVRFYQQARAQCLHWAFFGCALFIFLLTFCILFVYGVRKANSKKTSTTRKTDSQSREKFKMYCQILLESVFNIYLIKK